MEGLPPIDLVLFGSWAGLVAFGAWIAGITQAVKHAVKAAGWVAIIISAVLGLAAGAGLQLLGQLSAEPLNAWPSPLGGLALGALAALTANGLYEGIKLVLGWLGIALGKAS